MKRFFKKTGRFFFDLKQKNEKEIRQSILLVDGNFILLNNLALIIKDVREKFKNANLTVLTFKDKEGFIRDNFPDVEIRTSFLQKIPFWKIRRHSPSNSWGRFPRACSVPSRSY